VPLVRRLVHLIWGDQLDAALRPLVAQGLASSLAASAGWSFLGIWAIKQLHAGQTALGLAFTVGAILGALTGYAAGHASDYVGRKPLMLTSSGGFVVLVLCLLLVGHDKTPGLILLAAAPAVGGIAGSSANALIADLVPRERHEAAYASQRVASNLGATSGPVVGGALLALGGWHGLFLGVAALMSVAFVISALLIPNRGAHTPEGPPERRSFGVIRTAREFLPFRPSRRLAYLLYFAYDLVLH